MVPELVREFSVSAVHSLDFVRLARLSSERLQLEIDKAAIGRELRRLTLILSEQDGTDPARKSEIAALKAEVASLRATLADLKKPEPAKDKK
jgi:polyhydroxyalkanoate synthesis regulator phasin